ncbi:DinB family protein [Nocardioides sp. cx-173]|uniref:DinB family protein n=1 Tax=Nocardioides sp. cx-173 TaxID=2898796 RepID=UPI001E3DB4B6|nr:DinB family protein [Nocardioides sp. cx-173]MCD4526783.1 DinB family protein [Nocardioides sp. cx-173]UGB43889.1 DinB family protein [Nocardioides sp. cx-173]
MTSSAPLKDQLEEFLDQHRQGMYDSLDGLTEEEARRSLVPSLTTLLGLVKHATFVERVWFDEAVSGRSRAEIGIPTTVEESFALEPQDTVESVRAAYTQACADSRAAAAPLDVDGVVTGNRRGPLPLRWVYLHMLREIAQHCGHADILREQVLASRSADSGS